MTRPEPPNRQPPHWRENRASQERHDRIKHRPRTLRGLLRWAAHEYALEAPAVLQTNRVLDDMGDPDMTGEAKRYIGFEPPRTNGKPRKDDAPDNWRDNSCRVIDGMYATPLRCAIERIGGERGKFLRDVVSSVFFPSDVCAQHRIPEWAAADVVFRSLDLLWERYADRSLPTVGWVSKSESQRSAETDGEAA